MNALVRHRQRRACGRRLVRLLARLGLILALAGLLALTLPRVYRSVAQGAGHVQPLPVTVQQGDTLWDIAGRHYRGDVRRAVFAIQQHNNLRGAHLEPGQVLMLPPG